MSHAEHIVSQFTRTADAFATAPHILDEHALDLMLQSARAGAGDTSLDVACGAGIVACHFARVVQHATGIDLTPAMIDKARLRQASLGLDNVSWFVGPAEQLPFGSQAFSVVTTRYSLHHMEAPLAVLREMVRVCRPGGTVSVVDICVSEDEGKAARFNELERLHDPTHVRALPLSEHVRNFHELGLPSPTVARYKLDFQLSRLLRALGSRTDDAARAESLLRDSLADDALGTDSRMENGNLIFSYPIAVLTASTTDRPGRLPGSRDS